jgi:flavin reductase (DIM6/NTAB) family NADH-FMN oxidoreductase RutF
MKRFDPREVDRRETYHWLTRVVSPRPIAFVSTLSREGKGNLAPFSYFNLGGINPPSLVFSVLNDRHGNEKDTLRNIRETGEFAISVVTRAMAERMNATSAAFPRGVDEFDEAGFTRRPSELVKPPRVAESPLTMECRLHVIVDHGTGPLAAHYVIGEMLLLHADEAILGADGRPDAERIGFIGRMGADWYVHAAPPALFELARPPDPPAV